LRELDDVGKDELKDVLGKSWLTHDGTWFMSAYQQLGIDGANSLNLSAIRALAPIEVARVKRLLAVEGGELDDFSSLVEFLRRALAVTMPSSILANANFTSDEEDVIRWDWSDGACFAFKGMKMLGVMFRISCWLDALGAEHEVVPPLGMCTMQETGRCSGEFRIKR
jgi:hypothetical protein